MMKKVILLILICAVTIAFSQSKIKLDQLNMKAEKQLKILKENPNDLTARYALAKIYYDKDMMYINEDRHANFSMALEQIKEYLKLDQSNPDVYYLQGLAYYNNDFSYGTKPEARVSFTKVVELKPDFTDAWFWLGRVRSCTGPSPGESKNDLDAIEAFSKVIELDPNYKDAFYYRGYEYTVLYERNYAEGIKDFTSYLALDPDNELAMRERARSYLALKDYRNAGTDYKRLKELFLHGQSDIYAYERHYNECKKECPNGIQSYVPPDNERRQKYIGTYYVPKSDEILIVQENNFAHQMHNQAILDTKSGSWSISDDGKLMIHNQDKSQVDYFIIVGGNLVKDITENNNYGMNDLYTTSKSNNKKKTDIEKKVEDIFDIFK